MELIKKLIREELEKVLATLNELDFINKVEKVAIAKNPEDSIIYNYEKGRAFAGNKLQADIKNLNRYDLADYLPRSINEESWNFEFYTVYGTILMADIKRVVSGNNNLWSMNFGQLSKGENEPTLLGDIENINGYEAFVNSVNNKLANTIDPAKY